jgi:hypothetical protein
MKGVDRYISAVEFIKMFELCISLAKRSRINKTEKDITTLKMVRAFVPPNAIR